MNVEGLPYLELLSPLIFVLAGIYLLGPMLPLSRSWARTLVFVVVWLVVARYLSWRFLSTVLPADGDWYEVGWVYFCFAVEALALFDAFILYLAFLRTSDRRNEADAHEARLRTLPAGELPSVDVYIPTFNEPMEVLEKTITGVLCLDYPNFNAWVLDDGRRPWVRAFCEAKGVGYLTRPNSAHAKAGNINHALTKTSADFVAIFDADFIPQRNFLMRTMGFFVDPGIGVVQVPHAFYNYDPTQSSLALQTSLPDDQRFFFDAVMPSRDGWNAAFCCGSNSVTRRAALRSVGDALPTESITEDMLFTITLLRNGYITRYLCERLAVGLAPEGLKAFFVQRRRWARGAMQILYLAAGPLGRDLTLMQRLLFLPTHWLSQSLMLVLVIIVPLVFLWTGVLPLVNVTTEAILYYQLPMVLAVAGGIWAFAPRQYFPFAAQVHGTFQSFKILPTVLMTMAKPFGHVFKVTPKGAGAKTLHYDGTIFWTSASLMVLTIVGLIINALPEWRIIGQSGLLPIVAFWGAINVIVLFLVCMMSLQAPVRRGEERFSLDEPISIFAASGALSTGRIKNISLSGAAVIADLDRALVSKVGENVRVFIAEVGFVAATVVRHAGQLLAVRFNLPPCLERDLLIRKLFTAGLDATTVNASAFSSFGAMLLSIWSAGGRSPKVELLAEPASLTSAKLPAQSLVVPPHRQLQALEKLAAERSIAA
jgi:cellulose synthase/poly-beta-1,6-N-acetylglucosamine synthase-like glycosyltransferase